VGKGGGESSIVLLGTGTPNADPDRSGPSVAIVVDQTPYIVDFGPGVVRRASAAFLAGIVGLDVTRIVRAFVTHLHSDHTAGFPDLVFTPWVLGRDGPLEVYGPPGIAEMTEHILEAYKEDVKERLEGLEPANAYGHIARAYEVVPGVVYQDRNVTVEAFSVNHGAWPAYGYRFRAPDRTIVISGDTAPSEDCVKEYRGCDVLVHEVYSAVGFEDRSPAWQRYHSSVHTSSYELAEMASQAKPDLLILYHQLFNGVTEQELVQEVAQRYSGKVVSGKDLEVY
jgi:ribonuclease BN (tRNA processing enzyme)